MSLKPTSTVRRGDFLFVFISILVIASSFANIYKFADDSQPGNAIWAGIALFASSMLLASQLASMRQRGKK